MSAEKKDYSNIFIPKKDRIWKRGKNPINKQIAKLALKALKKLLKQK